VETVKNAYVCPICNAKDVSLALVSCGHTLCADCEVKLRAARCVCPFCRQRYSGAVAAAAERVRAHAGDDATCVAGTVPHFKPI
jgi:hypothetical protein